jgi:hypothetical protein
LSRDYTRRRARRKPCGRGFDSRRLHHFLAAFVALFLILLRPAPRPRRLAWSEFLRRVFAIDVLECPRCRGRLRLLAAIHPPDATQSILECLDLPSRAPPMAAPQPDGAEGGVSWAGDFDAGAWPAAFWWDRRTPSPDSTTWDC